MKKSRIVILIPFLTLVVCSFSYQGSTVRLKLFDYIKRLHCLIKEDAVAYNLTVIALDGNSKLIVEGVKLIVINNYGKVVDILITDKNGQAKKKIFVPIDNRYFTRDNFTQLEKRGTVAVIAYKEGYCETVIFEVPISPSSGNQQFLIYPVVSGQRNEPYVQMGDSHHLEIGSFVDKYRQYLNGK